MRRVSKLEIYGFQGIVKLVLNLLKTKIFFRRARLIRFPIEVRGKKYINFGESLTTGVNCRIEAFPYFKTDTIIEFGSNIQINDFVHIAGIEKVKICDNVLIASKVYISDIQHGSYSNKSEHDAPSSIPKDRVLTSKAVLIEKNVWIGESVSIMPGVFIGKGSIIGANSVVSKSIPEYCIAVGIPAKVIKCYNFKTKRWERKI